MRDEQDELLNDLLRAFHVWASQERHEGGFYSTNAACKLYKVSRQYDSHNGALDHDQDSERMEAVGHCIDRLEQPWKTAVEFNARNLATGAAVWRSPRLPADDMERAQLVVDARVKLLVLLQREGVA